ncbi:hypothetical protein D3C86_1847780 [compost metagenome]
MKPAGQYTDSGVRIDGRACLSVQLDHLIAHLGFVYRIGIEEYSSTQPLLVADAHFSATFKMLHQCFCRATIVLVNLPDKPLQVGKQREVHRRRHCSISDPGGVAIAMKKLVQGVIAVGGNDHLIDG